MAVLNIETCFNYCEIDKGFFSSNEKRWITKVTKLAEQYPDECQILKQPESNEGFIYAKLPTKWLKIGPPRKVEMTDEQKAELSERMRKIRKERAKQSKQTFDKYSALIEPALDTIITGQGSVAVTLTDRD